MQDELMSAVAAMVAAQCEEVEKLVKAWKAVQEEGGRGNLAEIELGVREWALRVGRVVLERIVKQVTESTPEKPETCPTCGKVMSGEGTRGAQLHSSMGAVNYARPYVRCRPCGTGAFPRDREFGLDDQRNSPALQKIISLAGTVAPFEKSSDLLGEIGSIVIAASKVERVTEQVGTWAGEWLRERQQNAMAGLGPVVETVSERLYVEADGTTVPMRVDEGKTRGENQRTEGKVEYKEVKVGAVFEATVDKSGKPHAGEKTYTGTFEDAEACVRQVVSEAKARGSDRAKEIVLLNDGGEWLWNRLPQEFADKKVTQILDWCHPSERLGTISTWMYGQATEAATKWAEKQRDLLYDGKVEDVIRAIERLRPTGAQAKEFVRQSLGYFREHSHRMDYAEFRARGYFIGSGVIESACKHIVNNRLKQAGMKWSRLHVPKILALRVCRASGWWGSFWTSGLHHVAS